MNKKFGWVVGITAFVGVFLSISALVGGNQSATPAAAVIPSLEQVLGAAGDIVTNVVTFTKGAKLGDVSETNISKTLEAGSNQVVLYRNQTGRDVLVEYGDVTIKTGETASSSVKFYIISTTTSSVGTWADFGTIVGLKGSLINGMYAATSSTASTTSSVLAAAKGQGNGTVIVPDESYLLGYLQQDIDAVHGCRGVVGLCEAATSTRRGFNPVFNVKLRF